MVSLICNFSTISCSQKEKQGNQTKEEPEGKGSREETDFLKKYFGQKEKKDQEGSGDNEQKEEEGKQRGEKPDNTNGDTKEMGSGDGTLEEGKTLAVTPPPGQGGESPATVASGRIVRK